MNRKDFMEKKYSFEELWDAVRILNPNQPIESDKNHILSMIIPNIISSYVAEKQYGMPQLIDINKNRAFNLLVLAYWHLCNGGVYNLKDDV